MQVTEVVLARTVMFCDVRLLNPQGLSLRVIHSGLLERYKFLRYPTTPREFDLTQGLRYGDGEFVFDGKPIGVEIAVYNNGWSVDTLVSTEASQAFCDDIDEWLTSIGFRSTKGFVTNTVYESQLVVQGNLDIANPFEKLQPFVKLIAELSGNPTQQMSGLYVGADSAQLSTFTFERRLGVPFAENKYFSRAALATSKHLRALNEIEKILE